VFVESLEDRKLFAGTAKFAAQLLGSQEVPPHDTLARGTIKFKLSRDGSTLNYKLSVKRIQNVSGAHIHVGQPGVNGGIAVDLIEPAGTKVGRRKFSVRGTITAAELTGPLAGLTMADLVNQMTAGGTYVNVHTNDGVEPVDTGPGDFPNGEVRGQVRRLGRNFNTTTPVTSPGDGGGIPGY
jgi:hypothetical protein